MKRTGVYRDIRTLVVKAAKVKWVSENGYNKWTGDPTGAILLLRNRMKCAKYSYIMVGSTRYRRLLAPPFTTQAVPQQPSYKVIGE